MALRNNYKNVAKSISTTNVLKGVRYIFKDRTFCGKNIFDKEWHYKAYIYHKTRFDFLRINKWTM